MQISRWVRLSGALLAGWVLLASGCGSGTGGRMEVDGAVTFEGQPVDGGAIVFLPLEGDESLKRTGGRIFEGKYKIPAEKGPTPGKYRVEIRWEKKTGRQVPARDPVGSMMDETRQVIPTKYNTDSELTADIQSGTHTYDFDLK